MSAEFRCVTPRNCTTTGDCTLASDSVAGARCRLAVGVEALPTCDVSLTSCSEEAPPDVTALQVLSYIEKIVDRPENGEMLLPFPWLTWFWGVAQHVVVPPFCMTEARSSEASAASLPPSFTAVERHIRHIVSTLAILDLGCSPSAGVVRVMIEGDQPEVLTRFAVEGIVSHFTHNQGEFSNSTEAMNILQNLNVLFSNVDRVFDSLSVTLALDIVKCISTLAVKNNSWVRMLMKECFRLFETRDRLCSVLLTTSDEFHKLDLVTLRQILEVNVYDPNALQVLFCRLADAVVGDDVNEVRVLVAMVRRFVGMSRDHLQALQSFLGSDCAPFADVILPGPSAVSSCLLGDVENVGVTDIIDWCRRNTARWDSLRERVGCSERVKGKGKEGNNSIGSSRPASLPMRSKLVTCGVSRRSEVSDQLERIMREVEVHMGGGPVVG
uniref:WGS project CAEQ00000000 data, annotated contig 958 n=1 Tax=Trypanosoma congolense (strain IL3000) TaxID=1068625 RepID=F9WJW1_TRYCI|nr:unnamed protein product [Trypanosoma congolense IL3000]